MTTQTLAQRIMDELIRQDRGLVRNADGSFNNVLIDGHYDLEQIAAAIGWQPMSEAPTDGTHCILAVRSGPFIFATQGAYLSGEWCAAFIDGPVEPLAWMPNVRLPEWVMQSN